MPKFTVRKLSQEVLLEQIICDSENIKEDYRDFLDKLSKLAISNLDKLLIGDQILDLKLENRENLLNKMVDLCDKDEVEMTLVTAENNHILQYLEEKPNNREKIQEIFEHSDYNHLKRDRDFVLQAVRSSKLFYAFQCASDEIKRDKDFILNDLLPILNSGNIIDFTSPLDAIEIHRIKMDFDPSFRKYAQNKLQELNRPSQSCQSVESVASFVTARSPD